MKVVRGDLQGLKGVPKNGLCIGIHRAGTMHKRFADRLNHPLTIWSLRPENEFLAYDPKEFEGKGLSATGNLDEVDGSVIFGVRGAPPQVREEAAKRGLEVVADATCPYVVEQEAAAMKFLEEGLNLVILSDPNHHGATRIEGIAKKMDRPLFIVEKEEDVEKITLMRQEPIGVIVQTTFWEETYKAILVEPDLGNLRGIFKKDPSAKLQIWLSDDSHRTALRIKTKIKHGTFIADLVDYQRPE